MIIARLANWKDFERIVENSFQNIDEWCMANNEPLIDRNDLTKGTPFIVNFLQHLEIGN